MKKLEGKVAIITGSSRGIGKEIAIKLAQEGAKVVINYSSSPEKAEEVVNQIKQQGGEATAIQADISQVNQIQQLVTSSVEKYLTRAIGWATQKRAAITSSNGNKSSKRLKKFTTDRNHKVKDYLHRASTYVINLLAELEVSKLVLGKNKGWKNGINIGKSNNQNMVQIPHALLIDMLTYKAAMNGISVIIQEESYTSKASFLNNDFIPTYGAKPAEWEPSGKRVKRGLYVTLDGIAFNADVNGSYNILVKAFPNAFGIGDREVLATPRKVNLEGHAPKMVTPF